MYPHIAITLGDPQGIGAEVAFQSVRDLKTELKHFSITFLGSEETRDQVPSEHEFIAVGAWDGTPKGAGQVAALAIEQAVTGVRDGLFHTIVTALYTSLLCGLQDGMYQDKLRCSRSSLVLTQ